MMHSSRSVYLCLSTYLGTMVFHFCHHVAACLQPALHDAFIQVCQSTLVPHAVPETQPCLHHRLICPHCQKLNVGTCSMTTLPAVCVCGSVLLCIDQIVWLMFMP
jgi:hypothetical protein